MLTANNLPQNRSFGFLFLTVFSLLSGYFFIYGNLKVSALIAFLAVLFLLASLFKPSVLTPLNYYWMKFGLLLGRIVSPIVISLIYVVIIVPYGLLGRVIGRDALRLHPKGDESFWVKREIDSDRENSFKDQF